MIRIFIVLLLFVFSVAVFAQGTTQPASGGSGFGAFFSYLSGLGEDFWTTFTVNVPNMIERLTAYLIEFVIFVGVKSYIASLTFAWNVAKVIIEDLQVGSQLNALITLLPNDIQAALVQLRILDAIELIIQAYIARFTLSIT